MIYYTTDGSDPKSSSTIQSNSSSEFTNIFSESTILRFYAVNNYGIEENVQTREYEILKLPDEDVLVYNNYLDLSLNDTARIIFGKPGNAEIKIYNFRVT